MQKFKHWIMAMLEDLATFVWSTLQWNIIQDAYKTFFLGDSCFNGEPATMFFTAFSRLTTMITRSCKGIPRIIIIYREKACQIIMHLRWSRPRTLVSILLWFTCENGSRSCWGRGCWGRENWGRNSRGTGGGIIFFLTVMLLQLFRIWFLHLPSKRTGWKFRINLVVCNV